MKVREMMTILKSQDPDDEVIIDTDEGPYKFGILYRGVGPDSVSFSVDIRQAYKANGASEKLVKA